MFDATASQRRLLGGPEQDDDAYLFSLLYSFVLSCYCVCPPIKSNFHETRYEEQAISSQPAVLC
jgi:hypothetical protein